MYRKIAISLLLASAIVPRAHARNVIATAPLIAAQCMQTLPDGHPHTCKAALNTLYDDKTNSFAFLAMDDTREMVSFLGDGAKQVKYKAEMFEQPVIAVTVASRLSSGKLAVRMLNAVGTCRFGRPDASNVIEVQCFARTADGLYEASFHSDGKPWNVMPIGKRR